MAKGKRNMRRKTHRKGTRKSRRMTRMRGGQLMGSNVGDNSMKAASNISLEQGGQYAKMHSNQHGGVADLGYTGALPAEMRAEARVGQMGGMAPVGDTGVLEAGLRESARIQPLDSSFNEIAGMKDQGGGGRRRRGRKSSKSQKRKSQKSKSRTNMRKSRRCWSRKNMRGGMADVGSPDMLLPTDMSSKAVGGMNPEWKLAENPNSFSPLTQ
jgi:hypothetical protein